MTKLPNSYEETRMNYEQGVSWHAQKFATYDWTRQIEQFVHVLNGNSVLDVGCGSGRDTQEFLKKGLMVEGLDFSHEMIEFCRNRFEKVLFHEGDLCAINLPQAHYDGLWACASILNLKKDDATQVLGSFRKWLKKDGVLFVSVKEGEGEKMVADQGGQRFFSFYSSSEINHKIESAGFEILRNEVVSDSEVTHNPSNSAKPNWVAVLGRSI